MHVEQIYDEGLAQASYILMSENEMVVIDPARDISPYLDYSRKHNGKIKAIIETHLHADFISGHVVLSEKTGAFIYISSKAAAEYKHQTFDTGNEIKIGKLTLKAVNTPGHSPDSISIIAYDEKNNARSVFTGDTLFVGDVGRPDLRDDAGINEEKRKKFAQDLYRSLQDTYKSLSDDVMVYPGHGAGSLCGKGIGDERTSKMGKEKSNNPALQFNSKEKFVEWLLKDQPFVPVYFSHDVELNRRGPSDYKDKIRDIPHLDYSAIKDDGLFKFVDVREEDNFKEGHYPNSMNIMGDGKFETWLGSLIQPDEKFHIVGADEEAIEEALVKVSKIGYEEQVMGKIIYQPEDASTESPELNLTKFKNNQEDFTIVDVRNESEFEDEKIFSHAINIPLHELRERSDEVPSDKPIVVHCASGFRSAAGSSILEEKMRDRATVYDLSDNVEKFK